MAPPTRPRTRRRRSRGHSRPWGAGLLGRAASYPEGDPLLAVHLADQTQDERDLGRFVALARAHDDRRNRPRLVEWAIDDIVPTQPLDRGRHEADAALGGHQPERPPQLAHLVYHGRRQAAFAGE